MLAFITCSPLISGFVLNSLGQICRQKFLADAYSLDGVVYGLLATTLQDCPGYCFACSHPCGERDSPGEFRRSADPQSGDVISILVCHP